MSRSGNISRNRNFLKLFVSPPDVLKRINNTDLDKETGESQPKQILNVETGEEENLNIEWRKRKKFKIPNKYIFQSNNNSEIVPKNLNDHNRRLSRNIPTVLLFLFPLLLLFFPTILLLLLKCCSMLHLWAHRRNHKLRPEQKFYYVKFLHVLWVEFCPLCVEEETTMKIGKFQDKRTFKLRNDRLKYVKSIVT